MLLNFSNHPSANWPGTQKDSALSGYVRIEDLAFPQIPPEMNAFDLDLLVEKYVVKIKNINPIAVHIMGELVFTYRLVKRLKEIGYLCIASTTERNVADDGNGNKTSTFKFVQFREY